MSYHTFQTIIIPAIVVFAVTYFVTKFLMGYLFGAGIIAEDRNKKVPVKLPSSGGLGVSFGIIFGILTYIFGASFIFQAVISIDKLFAVALSIMLIALVGFIDDINVKREREKSTDMMDIRVGLKQWQKPLLTLIGALPLMAINVHAGAVNMPFIGSISFGIIYPLIILPLAVIFISNAVNILGGFDGLQPGMILIASFGLLLYSFFYGNYIGTFLSVLLFSSVLAFLPFNIFPAKIIPGDSFTYAVGAAFASIAIMGNAEAFALIIFIPWIIEFFLHLRRKFKVTDLGILQKDGTMKAPYGKKIYSLTHLIMNIKKAKEVDVSIYLCAMEILFVLLAFGLKFLGLL
ncbi:MAG: hypothetical protein ACP5M9_00040 [Candidatus Micrarchaeia archaeon]